MNNFYHNLPPFAPDYSGAAGVLHGLGALLVICGAGGCSGNVCGYDEPRAFAGGGHIMSAALRELDLVLGRDDKLIEKVENAVRGRAYSFLALIGTPVTAVAGTDLKAVARLMERRLSLPVLSAATTGFADWDAGEVKAYAALCGHLLQGGLPATKRGSVGVFGATPLAMPGAVDSADLLPRAPRIGGGKSLFEAAEALASETYLAVSPAGLVAARAAAEATGAAVTADFPMNDDFSRVIAQAQGQRKVLVVHQAVAAASLAKALCAAGIPARAAAFGLPFDGVATLRGEDDLYAAAAQSELVIADAMMEGVFEAVGVPFLPLPHFALSGGLFL